MYQGKEKLKTRILILMLIVIIGLLLYFLFIPNMINKIKTDSYNNGYIKGKIDLAIEQTNTGNIFYILNNNVTQNNINEICRGSNE